ncbi:MAG: hypothetical protein QHI48_02330 [Bacteroidota bacterium]|nr:hypothetical protein [Bacteroidota bacterium]
MSFARVLFFIGISLFTGEGFFVFSQTPGKDGRKIASGMEIVNLYTRVTSNIVQGTGTVAVESTVGFSPGDLVMIYQAQGVQINTSDDSTYGNIIAYNNAGNYEFRQVIAVESSTLTVSPSFLQNYTASGNVQVVRVPQYTTLIVPSGSTITGQPWDGQKGGIVAVHVRDTAMINGRIVADTLGFRGGLLDNSSVAFPSAIPTYRSTDESYGGEKGESIAGHASVLPNGRYGRGAPANGGGGGNSHNSGGGGGANGDNGIPWSGHGNMPDTVAGASAWQSDPGWFVHGRAASVSSGGGRGGYSYSANRRNALNAGPGITNWGGDNRQEKGGRGGHPLIADPVHHVFFGGGGGAGDANNNAGGKGGRGGGIVVLFSNFVTGLGSVSADGANGTDTYGIGNDGPGGGGGGGSVIVQANTSISGISLSARGGKGGRQFITWNEAEGPGGGGGGGFIAYKGGFVPMSVVGGSGGETNSPSLTEFPRNGATDGASGKIMEIVSQIPLPVELVSFMARKDGNRVLLSWRTATESNNYGFEIERSIDRRAWTAIAFVEGYGVSNSPKGYRYIDETAWSGETVHSYRLRQIDRTGTSTLSPVVEVVSDAARLDESLIVTPHPLRADAQEVKVAFHLREAGDVSFMLYSSIGSSVSHAVSRHYEEGSHVFVWEGIPTLRPGAYLLVMALKGASCRERLVLVVR